MKISDQFERFRNEKAIFIVTSRHDATIYETKNGDLQEIDSFSVHKSEFTDKAGHYKTRVNGDTLRSGSVSDVNDESLYRALTGKLRESLRRILSTNLQGVFVFTPSTMKSRVISALPENLRIKARVVDGNFSHMHPFRLLEKIELHTVPLSIVRTSAEAQKILNTYRF